MAQFPCCWTLLFCGMSEILLPFSRILNQSGYRHCWRVHSVFKRTLRPLHPENVNYTDMYTLVGELVRV